MAQNRKCVLCGKEHEYCPNCPSDKNKALWHKLFCSENCKNIFNALNDYNFKIIAKKEAQEALSKCDLTIELNDHYRNEINAITTEPEEVVEIQVEAEIAQINIEKGFVEVEVTPDVKQKAKSQSKKKVEESEPLNGVVETE